MQKTQENIEKIIDKIHDAKFKKKAAQKDSQPNFNENPKRRIQKKENSKKENSKKGGFEKHKIKQGLETKQSYMSLGINTSLGIKHESCNKTCLLKGEYV